jgi:hypothetical protein
MMLNDEQNSISVRENVCGWIFPSIVMKAATMKNAPVHLRGPESFSGSFAWRNFIHRKQGSRGDQGTANGKSGTVIT